MFRSYSKVKLAGELAIFSRHPYSSQLYAQALTHTGRPFFVPEWDAWLLVRDLPTGQKDVCGVYPLAVMTSAPDWSGGLQRLREAGFISAVLVLDPLQELDFSELINISLSFVLLRPTICIGALKVLFHTIVIIVMKLNRHLNR